MWRWLLLTDVTPCSSLWWPSSSIFACAVPQIASGAPGHSPSSASSAQPPLSSSTTTLPARLRQKPAPTLSALGANRSQPAPQTFGTAPGLDHSTMDSDHLGMPKDESSMDHSPMPIGPIGNNRRIGKIRMEGSQSLHPRDRFLP